MPLWSGLELYHREEVYGNLDDDDRDAELAKLWAGNRQLLDFLTTVWGVGPVRADEAKHWQLGLEAASDSLDKLFKEDDERNDQDCPHYHPGGGRA